MISFNNIVFHKSRNTYLYKKQQNSEKKNRKIYNIFLPIYQYAMPN